MTGRTKGGAAKRKAAAIEANKAKRLKEEEEMDINAEIERRFIDLHELDLQNKQYVEAWKEEEPPQRPPRQERWKYTGKEIIFDRKKFPKGWNSQEPDLDEMDVDAQIVRCKERIEDGWATWVFEGRLKELEKQKQDNEKIKEGEPPNLPWSVYLRINALKFVGSSLWDPKDKDKDQHNQLPNIRAIIEEYRTGKLIWRHGLVTYWSNGERLSEPRPFDWDELEAIRDSVHKGRTGFWVEGLSGPGSVPVYANMVIPRNPPGGIRPGLHTYNMGVRLPGIPWHDEFTFLQDTGANMMVINDADTLALRGPVGIPGCPLQPPPPILGVVPMQTAGAGGPVPVNVIEVEVCILNAAHLRLTAWHRIQTAVRPAWAGAGTRVDGPIGRYALFTGWKPDNLYTSTMSTTKNGLNLVPLNLAGFPPIIHPILAGTGMSAPAPEVPAGIAFAIPLPYRAAGDVPI